MQGDELKKIPSEEVLDEVKVETVNNDGSEVQVSTNFSMVCPKHVYVDACIVRYENA